MTRRRIRSGEHLAIVASAIERDEAGFFISFGSQPPDNDTCGSVAVVHIRGALVQFEGEGGDSYEGIARRVGEALAQDPKPSTVVLRISSPGGLVSGLDECVLKLRKMSRDAAIPLVACCDLAVSAGYAIACACPVILAPRNAYTGSVGVISEIVSVAKMDEKLGVEFEIFTSGARKADGHPHMPISAGAKAAGRARNAELAGYFFELVSKARGLSVKALAELEAGIFLGKDAERIGLIDEVVGFDEAIYGLDTSEIRSAGTSVADPRGPHAILTARAYSDDQPREPAGSPDGGQFGEGGGGGGKGDDDKSEKEDLHVSATREQWSARPNRESLSKRLGKVAIQIKERDGHKCQYCGKHEVTVPPAKSSNKHALDHLIPRVNGGKDVATNLVLACQSCNSARHNMTLKEWNSYARTKYGIKFSPAKIWKQAEKPLPEITKKKAA